MTIIVDPTAKVSQYADIEDSARGTKIIVGPNTVIDSFVKIKPAGGAGDVTVGAGTIINSGCVIYTGHGVTIGKDVLIAANCVFSPVRHAYESRNLTIKEQRFKPSKGGIIIEDDVWIGAGSILLDGTILRKGCVIGAMSLVSGEVAPYTINLGNPLRQIGERT